MKYILPLLLFGAIIYLFFLLLWTNVTPGYFQEDCCGKVDYKTDLEVQQYCRLIECVRPNRQQSLMDKLKLEFGKLDFYR